MAAEKISPAYGAVFSADGFQVHCRRLWKRCKPVMPWLIISVIVHILFLLASFEVLDTIPHTQRLVYGFPSQADTWTYAPDLKKEFTTPGNRDPRFNYPFDEHMEALPEFPHTAAIAAVPFLLNLALLRGTAIMYHGTAFLVAQSVVVVAKRYVGALRPNFYNRCGYDDKTGECKDKKQEAKGRLSFPSGHSTLAAVVMGFWAWDWVTVFSATWPAWQFYFPLFGMFPALIGFFVCLTRYVEYYHFEHDIMAGVAIGICSAYYFHSLMLRVRSTEDERDDTSDAAKREAIPHF